MLVYNDKILLKISCNIEVLSSGFLKHSVDSRSLTYWTIPVRWVWSENRYASTTSVMCWYFIELNKVMTSYYLSALKKRIVVV